MTRFGIGAAIAAVALCLLGWLADWKAIAVLGFAIGIVVLGSILFVMRRALLRIERHVEPARVSKNAPAIALVNVTNRSPRSLPGVVVEQRLGDVPVRIPIPRLRRRETHVGVYRLPTDRRGVFELGPIEVVRADPFGICRTVQRLGKPGELVVTPQIAVLPPLPIGRSRDLEGPSTDLSPQGTVTFHRIREYVDGDDLRLVHWPSTARRGTLMVRHMVDTAQAYTVVLSDVHPASYTDDTFETSVDAAASILVGMSGGTAPVGWRSTAGERIGGPAQKDPYPIVEHLTTVESDDKGSLAAELTMLGRDRGGTTLVVITGELEDDILPAAAGARRRFDRVVVISIVQKRRPTPVFPGVTVLLAATLDDVARGWELQAAGK